MAHKSFSVREQEVQRGTFPKKPPTDMRQSMTAENMGLNLIRLLKALSNLTLNTSRGGASTTSLDDLLQCFTTLIVKHFFLLSNLNLSSFSSKPLPLVLSLEALVKSLSPVFLISPLYVLKGCSKISPEPSLLQAEQPQLSQPFFIGQVFQPSDHFHGPPLDPLEQVHILLVLGTPERDTVLQTKDEGINLEKSSMKKTVTGWMLNTTAPHHKSSNVTLIALHTAMLHTILSLATFLIKSGKIQRQYNTLGGFWFLFSQAP
ncbi:hypothetical protein QYF61_002649, partial [Mycteria americana]